jgi:hypothetical protein
LGKAIDFVADYGRPCRGATSSFRMAKWQKNKYLHGLMDTSFHDAERFFRFVLLRDRRA